MRIDPAKIPFMEPGEKILIWLDKHTFIYWMLVLLFLGVCIFPVGLFLWVYYAFASAMPIWCWWLIFWYEIFMITFIYIKFIEEVLDMIIVTDKRIVNIDQISFLNRNIATARISEIQDAKGDIRGIFGHLFKFGELRIQTAAHNTFFYMNYVRDPEKMQEKIIELVDKEKFKMQNGSGSNHQSNQNSNNTNYSYTPPIETPSPTSSPAHETPPPAPSQVDPYSGL